MPSPRSPAPCGRWSSATTLLAQAVIDDDNIIDQFEVEIDDIAIHLLAKAPVATDLRLTTVAMKISQNLERVGDSAVTIARRAIELEHRAAAQALRRPPAHGHDVARDAAGRHLGLHQPRAGEGPRRRPARHRGRQPQPPAAPRALELHGRAAGQHHRAA